MNCLAEDSFCGLPLPTNLMEDFDQDELCRSTGVFGSECPKISDPDLAMSSATTTETAGTNRLRSYLRIRPVSQSSCSTSPFAVTDSKRLLATAPSASQTYKNSKGRKDGIQKAFFFDQIFPEQVDQKGVYESAVHPLVQSFLNGDNALLFAYGMTSSGKSFTMRGNHKEPGVIPRTIHEVFANFDGRILDQPLVKRHKFNEYVMLDNKEVEQELAVRTFILNQVDRIDKSSNYSAFYSASLSATSTTIESAADSINASSQPNRSKRFVVWLSFLELYNDMLYDLLAIDIANERTIPLKLMRDQSENYFVSGLRHVFVRSAEEAHKVMLFGLENLKKHVQSTGMNKQSSRSHAVFSLTTIDLQELERELSYRVLGVRSLSLADLAGRERADKTGNVGIRMQEANRINVSLLVLNHCISVLRKNQKANAGGKQIVPFSNSNLTKVFKPYLCGQGLAAMFININPLPEHFDETYATLEFSATASEIVIPKVDSKKQIISDSLRQMTQIWLDSNKKKRKPGKTLSGDDGLENDHDMSYVLANQVRESILKNVSVLSDEIGLEETDYYKSMIKQLHEQIEALQSERAEGDLERQVEVTKKLFDLDERLRREFDERNERDIARVEYVMNEKIAMIEEEHRLVATEHLNRIDDLQDQLFESMETINSLQFDLRTEAFQHEIANVVKELVFESALKVEQDQFEAGMEQLEQLYRRPQMVDHDTSVSGLIFEPDKKSFALQTSFVLPTSNDEAINTSIQVTTDCGTDAAHVSMIDKNTSIGQLPQSPVQSPTNKHDLLMLQVLVDMKDRTIRELEEKLCQARKDNAKPLHMIEHSMNSTINGTRYYEVPMTERKKKREHNESSDDICKQYLNMMKDISPKTNRKKKRTESECRDQATSRPDTTQDELMHEINENEVDDLAFLIEGPKIGTKKPGRRSTIKSEKSNAVKPKRSQKLAVVSELQPPPSARKKIPNNHRDSFVIEVRN